MSVFLMSTPCCVRRVAGRVLSYWGPPKAEAARKGTRSRNGIGWHLDFAVAEIVDVKCVLTSFECSKGKKQAGKHKGAATSCVGQTLMLLTCANSSAGLWLTCACQTSPACPKPESTWPGHGQDTFMALLCSKSCSTVTAPDCFAAEPHGEMEDSVPAACLWDRISREGAHYRHLNPS